MAGYSRLARELGLKPFDLLLRILGPNYRPFFWFFVLAPPALVARVARARAIRAAENAYRRVPAYRKFVRASGQSLRSVTDLSVTPTDKHNYIDLFSPAQRCLGGSLPLVDSGIDESSGSTGTPYNWVRSVEERHVSHLFISHFARYCFGDAPWITINAFSMGAWATGINMGVALQRNSMVKNTGPDIDKIFRTLELFGPGQRYLICGYPPFLKYFIDEAARRQFPLEDYQLMAMLGGEGNSEGLRDYLYQRFNPVYSGYGATDVEIGIAGETPLSLAIRRRARTDLAFRKALFGGDSRLPMVFQYNPLMHYIEVNERNELIFTISRLNVVAPRIRYNIHDEGGVASYARLRELGLHAGVDLDEMVSGTGTRRFRLPFLWIFGRADSTVSVMGANIYPEDVEECLYEESDLARITQSYCLGIEEGVDAAVRPSFSFEVTAEITPELEREFAQRITSRLVELNADFREAMREQSASAAPVVHLFPPGAGPFAADARRIKQVRMLPRPTG